VGVVCVFGMEWVRCGGVGVWVGGGGGGRGGANAPPFGGL